MIDAYRSAVILYSAASVFSIDVSFNNDVEFVLSLSPDNLASHNPAALEEFWPFTGELPKGLARIYHLKARIAILIGRVKVSFAKHLLEKEGDVLRHHESVVPEQAAHREQQKAKDAKAGFQHAYTRSTIIATALPPPRHKDVSPRRAPRCSMA